MLTKRTQTRHITVGNEVMSVSTMEPPHELVGLTVEEAARRLQPESMIALVDQTGEISMTAVSYTHLSWGCIRSQGFGCSPIKVVRELGSERRETCLLYTSSAAFSTEVGSALHWVLPQLQPGHG